MHVLKKNTKTVRYHQEFILATGSSGLELAIYIITSSGISMRKTPSLDQCVSLWFNLIIIIIIIIILLLLPIFYGFRQQGELSLIEGVSMWAFRLVWRAAKKAIF